MRNEMIGILFFILLFLGVFVGIALNKVELFGFLGLLFGLGVVFLFRKRKK